MAAPRILAQKKLPTTVDAFSEFVSPEPNSGCWLWTGLVDKKTGYGFFGSSRSGVEKLVHRIAWSLANGRAVPVGAFVLHSCIGMRSCVNPAHLRLGSAVENSADMVRQGRWNGGASYHEVRMTGDKHPGVKISDADALLAERWRREGFTYAEIALRLGTSAPTIHSRLKRRRLRGESSTTDGQRS